MEERKGLYCPMLEHDNCGIGAVVNIDGEKTHHVVRQALEIVENLDHRAGKDAEGKTGDGVGILLQISHRFFKKECKKIGISIGEEREYGVGMLFFPSDELRGNRDRKMFETIVKKEGLVFLGWRQVPSVPEVLSEKARGCMPDIWQAFIQKPENVEKGIEFDRRLYVVRREFEKSCPETYPVSLSSRTIVYKGMFLVRQLRLFFADLQDPEYESAIALVHSRFSTNTEPSWERAHPNRFIVHNGEINTIQGNADKMLAREENMRSACFQEAFPKILPVVDRRGSDSAMLDNVLEFLTMNGMELPLAVTTVVPEPWENDNTLTQDKKDFYQYYATMLEPWDGPASVLFSDGDILGAVLDRNGLRPSRYYVTKDNCLFLASEVGVLAGIREEDILEKGRIHPGKMLVADTVQKRIIRDEELKTYYAGRQPYGEWLNQHLTELKDLEIPDQKAKEYTQKECERLRLAFGYEYEDYHDSIYAMALNGAESIESMGADTPLAVLSKEHQPLFYYFKQRFAQVTNPPIDSVREKIVTSTSIYIGKEGNLLKECPENCRVLKVKNPILSDTDMMKIKALEKPGLRSAQVSILCCKSTPLKKALDRLFIQVDKAYEEGANILVLTDRGVDENHVAIPSLLAVSAVHHYLVRTKKSTSLALILESAEPREVHHFAVLLGYGACAVNPYLAHETIREMTENGLLDKDCHAAIHDYDKAVLEGIVKIASKMGISTLQSYQGAQIFEAVGISKEVIDAYFTNTISRVGGITLADIQKDAETLHTKAFDPLGLDTDRTLPSIGRHRFRSQGEYHRYNPKTIHLLQQSLWKNDYTMFKAYTKLADGEETGYLRSLLDFNYPETGVPISEVESAGSIVKRFKTGAMSYGSISREAHETLALAMNKIQGKSNSGEGGEDPERFLSKGTKEDRCSAIKQVASGRFGVTSRYLVSADEIQIKMAQGAKPGEGGHLPGKKVYPWIARTRYSTPGVSLISPPPHHDIYSIEDLAQLIYDLKNANKEARISVKLVSEAGVGTIASGVAKAGAQVILISGYDGGTGAAPGSSIHNAGLPWELGLSEAHQTLLKNGLRRQVRLETDGKLMSGRDVAVAAMLGAEEFGFATAPLVALGCVMMRVCNEDTCPMGVATQNPKLRKCFQGKPEYVIHFMEFIAEELREYMARLGIRTVDELVGRTDLLKVREYPAHTRAAKVDLSAVCRYPQAGEKNQEEEYDFGLDKTLDETVLVKEWKEKLKERIPGELSIHVRNTDRTFGTIFGSEITRQYPDGLPDDTYKVNCTGNGGQSFGAFIPKGLTITLRGDSNDYFGKGLSGGTLAVCPPENSTYRAEENMIVGNVALYGATSGNAYINGIAGERFCVRNSGAAAVVEGVGDHGCEYMTGGKVAIIGKTGKNFAAGMSGGVAYVLDETNSLYRNINPSMIWMEELTEDRDKEEVRDLLEQHVKRTGSKKARRILDDFQAYVPKFKKIIPKDYKNLLKLSDKYRELGMSMEEAKIKAFYESTGQTDWEEQKEWENRQDF